MRVERNWRRLLADVPDYALEAELSRRRGQTPTNYAITLPGVTVDPAACLLCWRGDEYTLIGRHLQVVYALAVAHRRGQRRVKTLDLAWKVWRGWDQKDAVQNLRVAIGEVRKRIPGLIDRAADHGSSGWYALHLDVPQSLREAA